jgi:hypothetical protein
MAIAFLIGLSAGDADRPAADVCAEVVTNLVWSPAIELVRWSHIAAAVVARWSLTGDRASLRDRHDSERAAADASG